MKNLKFTDEQTFETVDVEVEDRLYDLTHELRSTLHNTTEILTNKEGIQLSFGILFVNPNTQLSDGLYKVTIEKIKSTI